MLLTIERNVKNEKIEIIFLNRFSLFLPGYYERGGGKDLLRTFRGRDIIFVTKCHTGGEEVIKWANFHYVIN